MTRLVQFSALVVVVLLALPAAALDEAAKAAARDKVTEWERAAVNREWAAITQVEQGTALQGRAAKMKEGPFADSDGRRAGQVKAGNAHLAAAKAYGSAVDNFDRAAANWKHVADLSTRIGDREQGKSAGGSVAAASADGATACRLAAQACELAAQAFAPEHGNQVSKAALASQQAAVWLERLASR